MKRFKNILFVNEPATDCEEVLDKAVTLAQNNQANLTIIDVVEPLPTGFFTIPEGLTSDTLQQAIIDDRQEQLEHLVAAVGNKMTVDSRILCGIPHIEITRDVLREGYDLVVKPAHNSGGLRSLLFGGTDLHLLRKCPAPVWLMKMTASGKLRKILAAVDIEHEEESGAQQDALSLQILELAGSLALAEFSELHIVHAWQAVGENTLRGARGGYSAEEVDYYVDEERKRHREWVSGLYQEAIRHLGDDALTYLKPQVHLPNGPAKEVIPQLVQDIDFDLVVMGTVARTGIPGFFMGNTAEMIINNINCSVLAIKPEGFVTPVTLEDA